MPIEPHAASTMTPTTTITMALTGHGRFGPGVTRLRRQ
jgi:hypothetical protein